MANRRAVAAIALKAMQRPLLVPGFASRTRQFSSAMTCRSEEMTQLRNKLDGMIKEYENFNGLENRRTTEEARGEHMVHFGDSKHLSPELDRLRVVPKDTSFFMANPPHEEIMRELNDILQMHINIPTIPKDQVDNKTTWISQDEYKSMLGGEHFKPKYYKALLKLLNRLSVMDPQLKPEEVRASLQPFTKRISDSWTAKSYPTLDDKGRAIAVGRRKTASARVQMAKANENAQGQILVNGRPLDTYFKRLSDRINVMYPLTVCGGEGSYNVFVTVTGGGISGQAGAVAHGIARALVIHNPLFLTRLSRAKCLQRDPRRKERKKPGKPKARKSYTWVKR